MASTRARALRGAAVVALGAGLASQGSALNITLVFNAAANDQFVDPFGVNRTNELHAIMNAAASIWEDIIETNFNLTINYWWDDLNDANGTIGLHNLVSQAGGRETEGNIRFDTMSNGNARRYFFDPTPFDDSEFNMQQTLWRDLSAATQADWFNGAAQNTFEVGYQGNALAAAPADARLGIDLLSVALHELGHALGMSSANNTTVAETADNDYDFNPNFMGGLSVAAEVAPGGLFLNADGSDGCHCFVCGVGRSLLNSRLTFGGDADSEDGDERGAGGNIAHLEAGPSLMFPSVATGRRTGVGATDALAAAAGGLWTILDLPRKEFIAASSTWTSGLSWIGGAAPGSADDTFVRAGRTAILGVGGVGSNGFARNLFVSEAATINVNANSLLNVFANATIDGANSRIIVGSTGELQVAGQLQVINGGRLWLTGGLADLNGGGLIDASSEIFGQGTVDVAGAALVNNGSIVSSGGTLTLQSAAAGLMDLDGTSGAGRLVANLGNITVTGTQSDAFNGEIIVGATRTVTLSSPWTLDPGGLFITSGLLDLNGSSTDAATLAGGLATLSGRVEVSGIGFINSQAAFTSTSNVTVASGGRLELNAATTMNGGSYTGAGEIQADGALTINGSTSIDVATFDWDGFSGATQTTVNNGSLFTINSNFVDDANNFFDGTVTLNGGSDLTVNTGAGWNMAGSMVLNGGSVVSGKAMTVSGALDSNLANTIQSAVAFTSGSSVALTAAGDILTLNGATTYAGGSYTGLGRLVQNGAATVTGNTTISVGVFDWDGGILSTTTINAGRSLVLNVGAIDVGNDQFDGVVNILSGASLTVNNTANTWTNGANGQINLAGGSVVGDELINDGLIAGFGTVTARVVNNGAITANGGTITLNAPISVDIDGEKPGETGVLNALNGNITVQAGIGPAYEGTMNIGSGRTINLTTNFLDNGGAINMAGGTLQVQDLDQNAALNVTSATAFIAGGNIDFNAGSQTSIATTLDISGGTASIAAGASMTGAGRLRNNSSLTGSFAIAVDLENRGTFSPGAAGGVGFATIDGDLINRSNGTLHFQLNGLAPNQFDRLTITGNAGLDGTLNVALGGGFVPDWGDSWSIMNYGSVTQVLDVVSFAALADPLLRWWWEATPTTFDVGVRHVADVNRDGAINFEDLNIVVSFFNTAGPGLPGDADEDGDVDFQDLNYVVSFFNTFAPPNLVPTPGAATLLAFAMGLGLTRRRRS